MSAAPLIDVEDLGLALAPRVREEAVVRPTSEYEAGKEAWKRLLPRNRGQLEGELDGAFRLANHTSMTEDEAVAEAARCLGCADAPCQKGCPASVDVRAFVRSVASRNFYGAAKAILKDNPCGLSCGLLCTTSDLCAGNCTLASTRAGPINIGGLQEFAVRRFGQLGLAPLRGPKPPAEGTEAAAAPVALVGAGPASISCATYLARLGYTNLTVLEAAPAPGGISTLEIPAFRLPDEVVRFEVRMAEALGVRFRYGRPVGGAAPGAVPLDEVRASHRAVFLGVGKTRPRGLGVFEGLGAAQGYYTSKDFLPAVARATKASLRAGGAAPGPLPDLRGRRVLVLGAGDVAMDCSRSALRCGARRVTVVLRRNTNDIRATPDEQALARDDQVDFVPYSLPRRAVLDEETGRLRALELVRTEIAPGGRYVPDEEERLRLRCDVIVSAFGAVHGAELDGLVDGRGLLATEPGTGAVPGQPGLFAGGDIAGGGSTVQAVNDGKTAAWGIHRLLQAGAAAGAVPAPPAALPGFYTDVDRVDLSVTVNGVRFPNPFGLASAPPCTSVEMIARGFRAGWGFAVTKTFTLDRDVAGVVNVTPRIMSSVQGKAQMGRAWQNGFCNIELISEKTASYWLEGVRRLKADYPDRVVVASIMSSFDREAWQELARQAERSGADAVELNLSCPHMPESADGDVDHAMGSALGVYPEKVREVCRWVSEATRLPVWAKLTPNVTDITVIARAAVEGGAAGLTAINTVSGWVGFHADAEPMRAGVDGRSTNGGLAGNSIRPIALRDVLAVHRAVGDAVPISATGGIDSADAGLQFLYAGASTLQVCSAVMNSDVTVVEDMLMGLKALLYARGAPSLRSWRSGQSPPAAEDAARADQVPAFGRYEVERTRRVQREPSPAYLPGTLRVAGAPADPARAPRVRDVVGLGTSRFSRQADLPRDKQVVALVNDDLCARCGKCFLACADSGYQAVTFDPDTHLPLVDNDDCTGCGLCESVCPVPECISLVPRPGGALKAPNRGEGHWQ